MPLGSLEKDLSQFQVDLGALPPDPQQRVFNPLQTHAPLLGVATAPSLGRAGMIISSQIILKTSLMPNEASSRIALLARRGVKGSRPLAGL